MLAIDIETMGLAKDDPHCPITMVCLYDGDTSFRKSYPFVECVCPNTGAIQCHATYLKYKNELLRDLNEADSICCYNGVDFDLPFIAAKFKVPMETVAQWILKTHDIFFSVKHTLRKFYKLDTLLKVNGMTSKSAKGSTAVEWAREGKIQELEQYCMQDTVLTWELTNKPRVLLPFAVRSKDVYWSKSRFYVLCENSNK